MVTDYTHQLDQIVTALNRTPPWWQHPWILAGVAAMFGVVGGFLGQVVLLVYTATTKLNAMRRMAYEDIGALAIVVDQVLRFPGYDDSAEGKFKMKEHYRAVAPRTSEDYIRANADIYARLPERISYEVILNFGRELLSDPYDFGGYCRSTMITIARQFKEKRLSVDLLRKYRGKEAADLVCEVLNGYDTSEYSRTPSK